MSDEAPPKVLDVSRRRIRSRPWRDDADELVVRYEERGKGIDWDGGKLLLDGSSRAIIGEHDPDLSEISFALPPGLKGQPVRGTVTLEDRAGNRTATAVQVAAVHP